jgi:hypothetical protein
MPILFIHGVNVRDRSLFEQIAPLLRRWAAPEISTKPEDVVIDDVFWGDLGVQFAWNGASRPKSRILGMGYATPLGAPPPETLPARLETARDLGWRLPSAAAAARPTPTLASGFGSATAASASNARLSDLAPDAIADFLVGVLLQSDPKPERSGANTARLMILADDMAHDEKFLAALRAAPNLDAEKEILRATLAERLSGNVVGMGFKSWASDVTDRVGEYFSRAEDLPLYSASVALLEARKWAHDAIAQFSGDVAVYIASRTGQDSGPILSRVIAKLSALDQRRAASKEPLIVITHSMGGQIIYDLVSWFLPRSDATRNLRIDFWCATASQVGFFEEAKLFLASDKKLGAPSKVAFPSPSLGVWWNVWDYNDVLSFSVHDIIADVDDGPYDSGMPLNQAHGGYLQRTSFYRELAQKLRAAKAAGWTRP